MERRARAGQAGIAFRRAARRSWSARRRCPSERVRLWHFDHPEPLPADHAALGRRQGRAREVRPLRHPQGGAHAGQPAPQRRARPAERLQPRQRQPRSSATPSRTSWSADVDMMKRAGGNLARLMHYPQAPEPARLPRREGMMIWCEIPVWGGDDPQVKAGQPAARAVDGEMIERDYNHPCIIGWSVGNEMRGHLDYVKNMMAFTRGLDPHRIVTHVSNSGAGRARIPPTIRSPRRPHALQHLRLRPSHRANAATEVAGQADLLLRVRIRPVRRRPGRDDPRAWSRCISDSPRTIRTSSASRCGPSTTTAATTRARPPSGNREWGIVTEDRQPKAAYQQVRNCFQPVRSLTVTNGVIRLEPRGADEVPSFTLRGYKLKWDGGEIALPDLSPAIRRGLQRKSSPARS